MLSAEGIFHGFQGRPLLRGLSLSLAPGEVLGIGGASGAGKSTLGRILAGGLKPDRGRVLWAGAPLPERPPGPVQHVPQNPETAVDPRWRAGAILDNGGPCDPEVLEALGIRPAWRERRPAELSGGELARISLARFFIPATRVLVCDEISAQLDALAARDLWRALLPLARRRGIGLIVVSHDEALRRAVCGRQAILAEGVLTPQAGSAILKATSET